MNLLRFLYCWLVARQFSQCRVPKIVGIKNALYKLERQETMIKTLTDSDLKRMYCDFLDEVYGECKIAGYEYSTSRALTEIDPTAFRCGFSDWISSELDAGILAETETGEYYIK